MNAFAAALATLQRDRNLALDLVYRPVSGAPVNLRGWRASPDIDGAVLGTPSRQTKNVIGVLQSELPSPAKGDMVEVPSGTAAKKLLDFYCRDPQRLTWTLELAA